MKNERSKYLKIRQGKMLKTDIRPYNICILTAANDCQADGYERQLEWRRSRGMLPEKTKFLVYADPYGKRIGSGGSTVYVLYKLLERFYESSKFQSFEELLNGKRMLILHSGGDSRRLPAYSAVGKIFIPLPTDFYPSIGFNKDMYGFVTLFDIILYNLMQLPCLDSGQVIISSGDTLLSFDASKVIFNDSGVTGLAYPDSVEIASNHGVYIVPQPLSGEYLRNVVDFLQKPNYNELKQYKALDAADRAFVDTGVMNFSYDAVKTLMEASGVFIKDEKIVVEKNSLCENIINAKMHLDIYREIPFAMLGKFAPELRIRYPESFIRKIKKILFFVYILPHCEFFHTGTSKQLLHSFYTVNYTASNYEFRNFNKTKVMDKSGIIGAFTYNSIFNTDSVKVNAPSLIEGCNLEGKVQLEGENILTGTPKGIYDIKLQKGMCLACLPVNKVANGWVTVIYGIEDDFKKLAEDNTATFFNIPFLCFTKDRRIIPNDLWEDTESHELWKARFFYFNVDIIESMQVSLNLQNKGTFQLDRWRELPRMSLQEVLQSIDYDRLLNNYSDLYQKVNLESLATRLTPKSDLASKEIMSWCLDESDYTTAARTVLTLIEESNDILFQARLYKLLSNVLQKTCGYQKCIDLETITRIEALPAMQKSMASIVINQCRKAETVNAHSAFFSKLLENTAFELVCEAIRKGLNFKYPSRNLAQRQTRKMRIRSDEVVWACAPARIEIAGGWSDTPPYCLERGGDVLNVAVKLNGQYPIQVIGKIYPEPVIRINSIDLGENKVIQDISEILSFSDPGDWLSLPKSAFVASGIISQDEKRDLKDILKEFGGGIDLTLFSAVPSGSGLGTSSILGAASIACLSNMFGLELTQNDLFNRILYMEQLMTTGGGWQDQIGGVIGGVKLIRTAPGLFQLPSISWTDLRQPNVYLSDRFLLYYTGYRRMAKNILQRIVGRYLDRDRATIELIEQNRQMAIEMKEILDHRDIDTFGKKIGEVWELHKKLDPGISNENINIILEKLSDYVCGARLLGAGGGGFLFIVTKGVRESKKIREILGKTPPNDKARFFDFDIDPEGLKVTVL